MMSTGSHLSQTLILQDAGPLKSSYEPVRGINLARCATEKTATLGNFASDGYKASVRFSYSMPRKSLALRQRRRPQAIGIVEVLGNHALCIEKRSVQCNRVPHNFDEPFMLLIKAG
jgi:hypothetical protein